MKQLLIYLRFAQLFGHNCHNFVGQKTFFQDHSFFGDFYGMAEGFYDGVIERMIGLGEEVDPVQVQVMAAQYLAQVKYPFNDNDTCFKGCLAICKELCAEIDKLCQGGQYSEGTKQLLGGMADQLEVQMYKIQQRLKG
jgi:DNA-binding ferritin-like protein